MRVTTDGLKNEVAGFLRAEFLSGKINWDEAGLIMGKVEKLFGEGIEEDKLLALIRQLDDDDKRLTPLVFKLLGKV